MKLKNGTPITLNEYYGTIEYAKTVLHASKITLGVFTNNERARHCYEAVGFQPTGKVITYMMPDGKRECIEIELNI